jgi:GMP synthase-like glutamine amidotransferase
MRLAILDCATLVDPSLEKYASIGALVENWLKRFLPEASFDIIPVAYGAEFPDPSDYEGFVLPGSEVGVYDDTPWMRPLEDYLRLLRDLRKPLLGICFGHQMMAHSFGGRAAKAGYGMCVGRRRFYVQDTELDVSVMHQDQVLTPPPNAKVIGASDYCPNAVIAYDFPALSCQFHPEYEDDFVEDCIGVIADMGALSDLEVADAHYSLATPKDRVFFGEMAAAFFRKHL